MSSEEQFLHGQHGVPSGNAHHAGAEEAEMDDEVSALWSAGVQPQAHTNRSALPLDHPQRHPQHHVGVRGHRVVQPPSARPPQQNPWHSVAGSGVRNTGVFERGTGHTAGAPPAKRTRIESRAPSLALGPASHALPQHQQQHQKQHSRRPGVQAGARDGMWESAGRASSRAGDPLPGRATTPPGGPLGGPPGASVAKASNDCTRLSSERVGGVRDMWGDVVAPPAATTAAAPSAVGGGGYHQGSSGGRYGQGGAPSAAKMRLQRSVLCGMLWHESCCAATAAYMDSLGGTWDGSSGGGAAGTGAHGSGPERVPITFTSPQHYARVFEPLLYEEARCGLVGAQASSVIRPSWCGWFSQLALKSASLAQLGRDMPAFQSLLPGAAALALLMCQHCLCCVQSHHGIPSPPPPLPCLSAPQYSTGA